MWVPISVLSRLWQLDEGDAMHVMELFCEMSLATLRFSLTPDETSEQVGIVLHPLQLDFCEQEALKGKALSHGHAQLLDGYMQLPDQPVPEQPSATATKTILSFIPRPRWSNDLPEVRYLRGNVTRHLAHAGYGVELAALLLDRR